MASRDLASPAGTSWLSAALTAKPFVYVFNCDEDELVDTELRAELSALVAPAEAIFLDAKLEAEVAELDDPGERLEMFVEHRVFDNGVAYLRYRHH